MKSAIVAMLLGTATCWAAVSFDHTFGDHMVLQQGQPIPVRGEATGSGDVTLTFGDATIKAKKNGKHWEAQLPP